MQRDTTTVVLVGGLWLDGSVWDTVVGDLERAGHRPVALTLPGQGDGRSEALLDEQVSAVVAAVDAAAGPVVLVGHSAAASLVWEAADRRIDRAGRVVMIGGFPSPPGAAYADFFPIVDGGMPFPGWEAFEGPDSADLDDAMRERFAQASIPVPVGVVQGTVVLTDERRYTVPVTLICPEFSPEEAREWIAAGDVPELGRVRDLAFVDIDSGHWPMLTRPHDLAAKLDEMVTQDWS